MPTTVGVNRSIDTEGVARRHAIAHKAAGNVERMMASSGLLGVWHAGMQFASLPWDVP